ncbi:MAG: hypothetical protein KF882_09840, partial [Bacteroidia bacterium]|nr:hypothetical protein [Bacteroidia bacterium]
KLPENDGTNHVAHYLADVVSYSDYFPYGMLMPGRNGGADLMRYGFQNQEVDNEIKGTGNSVNYKYRMHDPRIGRFFAVDPLASKYPYYSPYAFSGNRVLDAIELEGLEPAKYQDQYGGQDIFDYELRGDQFTTGVGVIKDGQFTDLGDFHYVFVEFEQQIESMNSGCSPMESGNDYGVPLVSDNKGSEIQAESTFGSIAGDLAGPMADGAEEFGKRGDKLRKTTTPLKSTGDIEYYNNAWGGNQHVKTERVFGKNLTKRLADGMPVVGTALDIMEVWDGIQKDGGFDSMGKNTAKEFVGAVGGAVGGTGGAWGGALTGAAIGSVIPGVGTVIGGFIGGVAGAFFGSWGGEAASETLIENVVK